MSKGSAIGILASSDAKVKIIREGNATMNISADNGHKAYGYVVQSGAKVNVIDKDNAVTQAGLEHQTNSTGSEKRGEPGEAVVAKVEGGNFNMTRQDNSKLRLVPSDRCEVVVLEATGKDSKVQMEERGNASIHVVNQGGTSQCQNDSSGAAAARRKPQEGHRLNDDSDSKEKICITCKISSGKGATERIQVDRDDKVQVIVDKYGEPGAVVYCGDRQLDCDKTFADNGLKDGDVIRVENK